MKNPLYSLGAEYYLNTEVLKLLRKLDEKYGINFSISPAALKVHDAYPGGLETHTRNVLKFVNSILETYQSIYNCVNRDLVMFSAIIHDIGKITEYTPEVTRGKYHWLSHLGSGIEIMSKHKEDIIEVFGEEGYYRILSVIQQHHGEFSESCHTLEAYIVHKADMLEAQMAKLNKDLEDVGHIIPSGWLVIIITG
jgi:3'-5' exoribonuclease